MNHKTELLRGLWVETNCEILNGRMLQCCQKEGEKSDTDPHFTTTCLM